MDMPFDASGLTPAPPPDAPGFDVTGLTPLTPEEPSLWEKAAHVGALAATAVNPVLGLPAMLTGDADTANAIWKGVETAPALIGQAAGGALRALGETGPPTVSDIPGFSAADEPTPSVPHDIYTKSATTPGTPANIGKSIYDSAAGFIRANTPQAAPGSVDDYAFKITQGLAAMAPIIGLSMLTKNPTVGTALGAGIIGAQSYGEKYGAARDEGRNVDQASMDAGFSAIINGAMASLPLHVLMKPGGTFLGQVLKTAGAGAFQGAATTALQIGYDQGVVDKNMSAGDAFRAIAEAGITNAVIGGLLGGAVHAITPRAAPPLAEDTAAKIMDAPAQNVGDVIRTAEAAVIPTHDVEAMATTAKAQGEENVRAVPDEKLAQLATALESKGITTPLRAWEPGEEAAHETVPPELVAAQRDIYGKAGLDVVYYHDDPTLPNGMVDPSQPDTLFLSNNPNTNAAEVGFHELTHAMADTKLPDGVSLQDVLRQQIQEGATPLGWSDALNTHGREAPQRSAFAEGEEGHQAYGDAVIQHLTDEMGADIGGEAPRFAAFIPKVVEALEAKYSAPEVKTILGQFIDSLKAAVDRIQQFFTGNRVSENWVTNLTDIHDTLAKMYAEKFGSQIEREQARVAAMADVRDKTQFLNDGTLPQPPPTEMSSPLVGGSEAPTRDPAYQTTLARVLDIRRWLAEEQQKQAEATATGPQAVYLRQAEATILGKVAGVEDRLTGAAADRLATVRGQLQDLLAAPPASRDIDTLREGLTRETQRLANLTSVGTGDVPSRGGAPTEAPVTPQDIHAQAADLKIPSDNAPDFMKTSELITGESHLNATPPEGLAMISRLLDAVPEAFKPTPEAPATVNVDAAWARLRANAQRVAEVDTPFQPVGQNLVDHLDATPPSAKELPRLQLLGDEVTRQSSSQVPDVTSRVQFSPKTEEDTLGETPRSVLGYTHDQQAATGAPEGELQGRSDLSGGEGQLAPSRAALEAYDRGQPLEGLPRAVTIPGVGKVDLAGPDSAAVIDRVRGQLETEFAGYLHAGGAEERAAPEAVAASPKLTPEQMRRSDDYYREAGLPTRYGTAPVEAPANDTGPKTGSKDIAGTVRSILGTGAEEQRAINDAPYKVGTERPQIEAAQNLIETDYARAIDIAMRRKQPPPGVHPEFVFMAVEAKATRDGDAELINRLATSRIAEEATAMGQRIGAWKNRDPLSAAAQVQAVQNARAAAFEASQGDIGDKTVARVSPARGELIAERNAKKAGELMTKEVDTAVKDVATATKTVKATTKRLSFDSVLESMTCKV